MPRFSVVVPVYNAEKYLEKCIDSVLLQSFNDLELVLVNDGSTDSSGHICDRFAASDKRVKVIHQKNQGHITARMNGVKAASGEYILFLDSDDYWFEGLAEKVDEKLTKYNSDIFIFRLERGGIPCHDFFKAEKGDISREEFFQVLLSEPGLNALPIKAVKASVLKNIDISLFASFKNSEDLVLTVKMASEAEKISYIQDILYYYRETPGSITHSYNPNGINEYVWSRAVLWEAIEKLGLANSENRIKFNNAFLWHVSEYALQISKKKKLNFKNRKIEYKKITDMPRFVQAVKNYDPCNFSTAKRLRINLLKSRMYFLLYLTDRIRLKF